MSSEIPRNMIAAVVITAVIVSLVVGGISFLIFSPEEKEEADTLVIYHWWTSGGEKAAIDALVKVFTDLYPDTSVQQTTVAGGAGFNFLSVIKTLVLAEEAPDAFQMHAGYEAVPYFEAGALEQIDDIWTSEGLDDVIPDVVQEMCKFEDHFYAVPVNIHRSNVMWYNKPLLDANGIDPSTLTDWTTFIAALETLKNNGTTYPLYMGETWTASHLFEQIMASRGVAAYEKWINGQITDGSDTDLVGALNTFKDLMAYINTDHATLSWDDATSKVITGDAAFNIMGDWANGEFSVAEMTYGTDYGTFAVPGTTGMYGLVIDSFQHPKDVAHPTNSDRWLKVVGSKAGQDAFNPLKGSISARTDSDTTKYGPYHQAAISDFTAAITLFPSVVHGSGAPETFKVDLNDIISSFVVDLDVTKAANAIAKLASDNAADFTKTWDI